MKAILISSLFLTLTAQAQVSLPLEIQCREVLLENFSTVPYSMLDKCRRVRRLAQYRCISAIATNYSTFPVSLMDSCLTFRTLFAADVIDEIADRGFAPLPDSIVRQVGQTSNFRQFACLRQYIANSRNITARAMRRICF